MKKEDLKALKNWLSRLGVLNAQNGDLIDDAIYCCDFNEYRAKKRLSALAENLRTEGHKEEAKAVDVYT